MEQIRTKEITIDDTNAVKGIAILLLLFHHLFFQNKGLYIDYYFSNIPIVQIIGSICKVCVALFVLLSGYGLTKSWNHKMPKLPSFYLKHCTKLFLNYWFWWIVFVPIGFIWFGYTWTGVYGNDFTALRGIIDGIGLAAACHTPTINPTWWFYSCILILYLIFPLIYHLAKNKWWAIAMVVMSALFFRMNFVKFLSPVQGYLLVFVCGVIFAQHNLFDWLNKQRWNNTIMAILFVIVFADSQ
jgi:surface polysaccharide O-acyltransferase-like enzyme